MPEVTLKTILDQPNKGWKTVFYSTGGYEYFDETGQRRGEGCITGVTRQYLYDQEPKPVEPPPLTLEQLEEFERQIKQRAREMEEERKKNLEIARDNVLRVIDEVLETNPPALQDYLGGNARAFNALIGVFKKKYPALNGMVLKEELEKRLKTA